MPAGAPELVLALDIGSSSARSALFGTAAVAITATRASRKYELRYTADGGAELDAGALLRATRACLRETLRAAGEPMVLAVSASAFWHGLLALDRGDKPISPVFTWADNRSAADAAALRADFDEREIQLRTGCMLRASYWPAKLRWLRRTSPSVFRHAARWTSPSAWIFGQLFGASSTSHSMASGTGLYNLQQRAWDVELCERCYVKPAQLGVIDDCPTARRLSKRLAEAQVLAAIGDGAASNLGSGADRPGRIAINIGTSAAVRVIFPRAEYNPGTLPRGLFSYVVDDDRLVIGGATSNAGNLRAWCARELQLDAPDDALSRDAAANDTLTVLPYLVRERAPTWPDELGGTVAGLTHVTSAGDLFRAATTASYYRLADILDSLKLSVGRVDEVIVSGGVLKSPASLRILADCLGRDIRICRERESSLRGAAIYALEQLGFAPAPLRDGKLVKHNRSLAAKHRKRRAEQARFEKLLSNT